MGLWTNEEKMTSFASLKHFLMVVLMIKKKRVHKICALKVEHAQNRGVVILV